MKPHAFVPKQNHHVDKDGQTTTTETDFCKYSEKPAAETTREDLCWQSRVSPIHEVAE
jgi:hypothetical protein